jgi:hypothetical protein
LDHRGLAHRLQRQRELIAGLQPTDSSTSTGRMVYTEPVSTKSRTTLTPAGPLTAAFVTRRFPMRSNGYLVMHPTSRPNLVESLPHTQRRHSFLA